MIRWYIESIDCSQILFNIIKYRPVFKFAPNPIFVYSLLIKDEFAILLEAMLSHQIP